VTDYLRTGDWQPRQSVATLASAMDVGNPSNMERLRSLYPAIDQVRGQVSAYSVGDAEIRATIRRDAAELGQVWCPHTATAAHVYREKLAATAGNKHWVLVSTAHPAKFNDIVEPLIGREVPVPPALAALLSLPRQETRLDANLDALRSALQKDR
jgi:threonine synthase